MPCDYNLKPIDDIPAGDFEAMKKYFNTNNTSGITFYVLRTNERSCYILGTYIGTARYTVDSPETFKHHVNGYTVQRTQDEVDKMNKNTLLFSNNMKFTDFNMTQGIQICTGPAPAPRSWFSFGGKKNRKTASKKRRRTKNRRTKNRRTKDRRTKRKTLRR